MLGCGPEILYNMILEPFQVRLFGSPICMWGAPALCIMTMRYSDAIRSQSLIAQCPGPFIYITQLLADLTRRFDHRRSLIGGVMCPPINCPL